MSATEILININIQGSAESKLRYADEDTYECKSYLQVPLSADKKAMYLKQMLRGSLNLSRTKVRFRRFMAPQRILFFQVPFIAYRNYKNAADYILENYEDIPLNLETAIHLNILLTKDLVPEIDIGSPSFRSNSAFINEAAPFNIKPIEFFYNWLSSVKVHALIYEDAIVFAEMIHNHISALDSFPDGNGRLARLMADLVLLKAGFAPAAYTNLGDYFNRGGPRSDVSRSIRKQYFHEAVIRGQAIK